MLQSESIWNSDKSFIYTIHTVEVGKIFEGARQINEAAFISVATEGGVVGLDALKVNPSLELQAGEVGIFFLKNVKLNLQPCESCQPHIFQGVASEQSFVKYDELTKRAHGYYEVYDGIEAELYAKIQRYTGQDLVKVKDLKIGNQGIKSLAAPVISSLSVDTVTAGTLSLLTISGSNFGIIRDKGKVEFLDPNFGDGRYFDPHYPSTYKSWSNTKIEVYIPSRAGTGAIRVTNNNNESKVSCDKLFVKYAHSNVEYGGATGIDSGFYRVNLVSDNSNGGYTWNFNTKFASNNNAVNAFLRAAENWRCETLANWEVGSNTTTDAIARDNENVVRFTKFGDSRLGVCYSWYNGCFNGGNVYWFVAELDVDFDSTRTWYYGTGKPGKLTTDFETVATHELGHGHQLSHVIDETKIMHYSLGPGVRNVVLSDNDVEGGDYVRTKSLTGDPCGPGKYKAIKASDCNITKPEANFTLSDTAICPNNSITLTDATKGKVKSYAWSFGNGSNPTTATTQGPHTVGYSSQGSPAITLIVTNDFGSDTLSKNLTVRHGTPQVPVLFAHEDTLCIGKASYGTNTVEGAIAYNWKISGGGKLTATTKDTMAQVDWTNAGKYVLSVSAGNICGISSAASSTIDVLNPATPVFSTVDQGLTVQFTNTSLSASSYRWDFGDGDSLRESHPSSPSHKYPTKGSYKVKLTAYNACSDSTIEKDIVVNYGLGYQQLNSRNFRIYPNPAAENIYIECSAFSEMALLNNVGQEVLSVSLQPGINKIPVKAIPGLYTLIAISPNGDTHQQKLVLLSE